jgi:hypothetical protein
MTDYTSLHEFAAYAETEAFAPSKPKKRDITADELRAILHYDPETGWLTNSVDRNRKGTAKAGTRAGSPDAYGYRQIQINGKRYKEHRLVWLYVHSVMPTKFLDHINNVKDDNRIENLREATNAQNMVNRGAPANSTSRHTGVSWHAGGQKWAAAITVNYKKIYLGLFTNIEDAIAARRAAELKYFGDFAYKGAA